MATEHMQNEKVGAGFQAAAFLIAFLCLFLFFSTRYYHFVSYDPPVPLLPTQPSTQHITIGLQISHFSTFNIAQNIFVMDGNLWFLFDPKEVSLEIIKKFDVFNGEIQHVSDPILIDHRGSKIAQFRIRAQFHTPLNYRLFPLDDHRVNFIIFNRFLPKDVTLQSKNQDVTFEDSLFLPGWRIADHEIRTGIKEFILEKDNHAYSDQQQEAIITFNCERSDPSIMINFVLTILLMLFLAALTFSSNEDSVLIVTVGIVALIGYRSVMNAMSPPQVSYFMYSDYMYLFALLGVILTLFGGIVTRDRSHNKMIKKMWITGVYALFVTACIITSLVLS